MRKHRVLYLSVAGALFLITDFGYAGDVAVLRHNPFSRPDLLDVQSRTRSVSSVERSQSSWTLRGIMLATDVSLANVDGHILGVGEEFDGYRLLSIEAERVVFAKNNQKKILSFDEASGERL